MEQPHPSHLDQTDPAKSDVRDIREEADREIEAYAPDLHDLVLLMPEDRWEEFLALAQGETAEEEGGVRYRGVLFRRAPVTAVVVQEGF
ncbi:hypothetical protein [Phenylobacterium sp.]|jgi:hypothetical protein|uniref:hypothetical protein n=1 Tax=Phenylobacterium sp. TaxID=1871053 RepID=UPI002F947972